MFYLHVSNRTENLLRQLAEVIRVDGQPDIFAAELFLIQSQGMERMVGQTMADEFGSFCNFSFYLPLDFLSFVAEKLGMEVSPDGFQRQTLSWRLDALLRDISGDVYDPIRYYLSGEDRPLKRFQLARRLANIFDQYQVMRTDMLEHWELGRPVTGHPAERWQLELWRRLLQQGGSVHRGILFRQVIERLEKQENLSVRLPKRISVIGLHTMPPVFLQYLNSLACHMDVHLFLLSPCRHYWGNRESRKSRINRRLEATAPDVGAGQGEQHPLLVALGRQGRDLQNMMLESADFALELTSYNEKLTAEAYTAASILQRIQADLLEGRLKSDPVTVNSGDASISLVSCHSKLRELQVLKDHLLYLLHKDQGLELRNIIVMAPDIQEYAPLIPAVFEDIQHSIADRSVRGRNTIIGAFLTFLELFNNRFGWSEVLDLLRAPSVYPQFHLSAADLDTLQQWIVSAGIRWGLSGEQRREAGLGDYGTSSWREGLDRMLMGCAIDCAEFVDGVLPYPEIEGRGALALGGLCQYIDLIEQASAEFRQPCTISGWSNRLLNCATQLFGDSNDTEMLELRTMLIESAESISPYHSEPVDFTVIHEWLNTSAREYRSSSGFLRGQLTFCSMLPMRSIPFQVVCLIGLSDGVFPKNDNHDTFDLMKEGVRPGDRSPRADDRYQFLEALLAARSYLYLSYIGQSIKTNEPIPPSVVISEFVEILENSYGVKDLVVRHPLHPFSRRYFADGDKARLFSYNAYYCKTAERLQLKYGRRDPWWQGELDGGEKSIQLADLLRFYNNPQKYFIRDLLGIRLEIGDDLPGEREIFELSGLEKYFVGQDLLAAGMAGGVDDCYERLRTEGRWPLGNTGAVGFAEEQKQVEDFIVKARELGIGAKKNDLLVDIEAGGCNLTGTLGNLYENGVLLLRYGKLRGRDLLAGWIHNLVAGRLVGGVKTIIVSEEGVISFSGESRGPSLDLILKIFLRGCITPSPFFVEPAFEYARQAVSRRGKVSPLDKALQRFRRSIEQGYEPEWELLFGAGNEGGVLSEEFEHLCMQIMCPILGAAGEA